MKELNVCKWMDGLVKILKKSCTVEYASNGS